MYGKNLILVKKKLLAMKPITGIYECYHHNKTRLRYHIILITKYRRKCLEPIKDTVLEAFRYTENHSHIKIYHMNTDNDHIHLLISFPPQYSISQTINRLKQCTTNYLYSKYNNYLRNFYWRKKRVLWSDSFFCSTIGAISESKVTDYIKNQHYLDIL